MEQISNNKLTLKSSTIVFSLDLDKQFSINHVIQLMNKVFEEYLFLKDVTININVFMETSGDLLENLLFHLIRLKFGTANKVPKVFIFIGEESNFINNIEIFKNYNVANEFLNIVTILDVDYSYEVLKKKLELVNEKINLNHIKNIYLLQINDISLYTKALDYLKKFRSLLFSENSSSFWINISGDNVVTKREYLEILDSYFHIKDCIEGIPLLPKGILDILYCVKKLLSYNYLYKDNEHMFFNMLIKMHRMLKSNYYIYENNNKSFYKINPIINSSCYFKFYKIIKENYKKINNTCMEQSNYVKVRSSMADFINC